MVAGVTLVVAVLAVAFLGYTATGNQFLADQIADRMSTSDMQVRIEGVRGLLGGQLRVDRLELSDTKGRFARADDLAIDWSPSSLLAGTFEASRVAAGSIELDRSPLSTTPSEESGGGFSLPVEVEIAHVDLPKLALGRELLGRSAVLALTGSAQGKADRLALTLDARHRDMKDAHATADLAYAVNARTLRLRLAMSEGKGGLLATLLKLPDSPAIDIAVEGDGPLDGWSGKVRAALDGTERLALDGRHVRNAAGIHRVVLAGGGRIGDMMPPALRPLFGGDTKIDVDASFAAGGMLEIRSATVSNASLAFDLEGAIDPDGGAKLDGMLRPVGDTIAFRWPPTAPTFQADVRQASLTVDGPFRNAAIAFSADLARIGVPAGSLQTVRLTLSSGSFDFATSTGWFQTDLTAERGTASDSRLARLVAEPFTIEAPLSVTATDITVDSLILHAHYLSAYAKLGYDLDTGAIDLWLKAGADSTAVLPPALAARLGHRLDLTVTASGTLNDLAFKDLELTAPAGTIKGTGTLSGDVLSASLTGDIPSLAALDARAGGRLGLTATLSGPLTALQVDAAATSEKVVIADRIFGNLDLVVKGGLPATGPRANVKAALTLDGQPVTVGTDAAFADGTVALTDIAATIGRNHMAGRLDLGPDLLPKGQLHAVLPDIASVGRLADQSIDGDLDLTIGFLPTDGRLAATLTGGGSRIAARGTLLTAPTVDIVADDLLRQSLHGTIKAQSLESAGQRLDQVILTFDHETPTSRIAVDARLDDAPFHAAADIEMESDRVAIHLDQFSASPRGIALSLTEPATVTMRDGVAAIDGLRLALGDGRITVDGRAGERLDLALSARSLPAAVANLFSPDLGTKGEVDADVTVSGPTNAPVIGFDVTGRGLTVQALADAARPPLDITVKGTVSDGNLTADADIRGLDETGDISLATKVALKGHTLDISRLTVASEAANGSVRGQVDLATRTIAAQFEAELSGKRLLPPSMIERIGAPVRLSGTVAGTPHALTLSETRITTRVATADLSGSLKAGVIDGSLKAVLADLSRLGPDLAGKADMTATLVGPISAPVVTADIAASNVTLAGRTLQQFTARLEGVADRTAPRARLQATGTIDDKTIDVAAEVATSDGRITLPALKATVGRNTLTADLALDSTFLPSGKIRFDLPDLGLVAALAGQKASGDLAGEATLARTDDRLTATIRAVGSGIVSQGLTLRKPAVDLTISDLLSGQVSGSIAADEITAGNNRVEALAATFSLDGPRTDFKLDARYDAAPLTLAGSVLRNGGVLTVLLDRAAATPRKLPLTLAAPATITIAGGTTRLESLTVDAAGAKLTLSGTVSDRLDLQLAAPAVPLALANSFSPALAAAGTADLEATVTGSFADPVADIAIDASGVSVAALREAGRQPLDLAVKGRFAGGSLALEANVTGITELGTTTLAAHLTPNDAGISVDSLSLSSPALSAKGKADLAGTTLKAGVSGEIRNLTAFLPQAIGTARFRVDADGPLTALSLTIRLEADNADMVGKKLTNLVIDATATADPARPKARLVGSGTIADQAIDVTAEAVSENGRIAIPALKLDVGGNSITGALALTPSHLPVGKLRFELPDIGLVAALAGQKASGSLSGAIDLVETNGTVSARITAMGSSVEAQGLTVTKPDVDLAVADLANAEVEGTVRAATIASGGNSLSDLEARFTSSAERTRFDVAGRYDGAPLSTRGAVERRPSGLVLQLDAFSASPRKVPVTLSAPVTIALGGGKTRLEGLRITAGKGTIAVDGTITDRLDLKVKIAALPASLANSFVSGLDASGTIAVDATVTGTTASPAVDFSLDWKNAATSQVRTAGLPALMVTAKGRLRDRRLTLDTTVRGGGLTLTAAGTVDTGPAGALDLSVRGKLPFAAVEGPLAAQGLALKGNADFDLAIRGSPSKPDISGRISTAGAQFTAIRQNLVVNSVSATVALKGQTATIGSLTGNLAGGGKVSVSGTVGFAPGSGLPSDLAVKLDRAVYADGRVVVAKLSGDLSVRGPLQRSPTLGGTVRLRRADITIPERLPASLANANVKHRNAPADVARQSREIRADTGSRADGDKASGITLDLRIVAPRQIFVRGRGLDAELGGEVRISGSTAAPSVSGGFKMIRGRLAIIGKRLDFTTGEITFGGGLVPYLNMVASTTVNATTLNVNVNGLANDPSFSFTSSPALPQDEVLAQLIFGRESSSLSAFQIAQLADAVATLSGGQRTSLFDKLRQGLGIDDLNVGTDENGGAQVTAGKYLNRRTYLELKQGEDQSKSGVAINLDIGKGVKLRGEATADGNTSTGIFYEKEY